jgi:thioredoxin-related protein
MTIESPQKPKNSSLDNAANIAIILACAALLAMVANYFYQRTAFFHPQAAPAAAAKKGETLKALQAVLPAGTERALVVAVAPGCHYCDESLPFYKQLIEQRNQQGSPVKFIAAVPGEEEKGPESTKFAGAGVTPDQMVSVDFKAIKVPGTPTLMLVDNQGKILGVWIGKLDADGEKDVLALL